MTELKNNLIEILEDSSYAPFTFEELADISKIEKERYNYGEASFFNCT